MHTHLAMVLCRRTAAALLVAGALGGCITHSPEGVAYSTRDGATNVGATGGAAGGAVSGSSGSVTGSASKERRGNTPPGVDRDGHGPAAGAIVDPTGAATRGRPY
jgi:hypothetical protein